MAKLTLQQFLTQFNHSPWDDEEYARAIVKYLPEELPVVRASQAFLDACLVFDAAVEAAGIERD